jgi:dCTP deaminase
MSILADHQIAALCTPPTTWFDEAAYMRQMMDPNVTSDLVHRSYPENMRHAERKVAAMRAACTYPITEEQLAAFKPMIAPFVPNQVKVDDAGNRLISYGLSSYGYDARIAPEFKIFTNAMSTVVDPKNFDESAFVKFEGDVCIIPPNSFVLARTLERFCLPANIVGVCVGKSTLARVGINCLVTPLEPGWEGYLTLEFANSTPLPTKLYANEGGLQIQFHQGETPTMSYAGRNGKYQNQAAEITLPRT